MKSKIAFMVCTVLCFLSVPVFALDVTTDVLLGGFYNYSNIFKGSVKYEKQINYDTNYYDSDYRAAFKAAGGSIGCDCFFNQFPLGLYFRVGFMGVSGVDRTAADKTVNLENTEINFNTFVDVGAVYGYNIGQYFSLNVAPAVSMLLVTSEYRTLKSLYSTRATEDSLLGFGLTADLYAKFRYKYFVAAAGCAASFYPVTLVSSADSSINYSTNIRDTMAYNLRPYISLGVSIRERSGSTFGAGGN